MKEIKFYEVRYEGYSNHVEGDDFETMELAKEFAKILKVQCTVVCMRLQWSSMVL